ncbi:MAG: ParB/RepB/Spo0J family partition protein [Candidatus Tyrphobacter sp.]
MTSKPQRGLGRGLDALLGAAPLPVAPAASPALREIPLDRIRPNPQQPRREFAQGALDELAQSIAQHGVLVPVIVRSSGDGFTLVAGERRWRACAAVHRATIPAIVREQSDRDSLETAIVENLQRENLNALEEAAGFAQLIEEYALTQDDVAKRVGKSRPAIANALRLLVLPDAVKAMIVQGRLSAGHARTLLSAPQAQRESLATRAVAHGLSVRDLERLVSSAVSPPVTPARKRRSLSPEESGFEDRLRERFATRVKVVRSGSGGRIEFHFASEQELLDLGDRLLS